LKYKLISSSCNWFEILVEISKKLGVMGMNGVFHCTSHCDPWICFVMEQVCHNRLCQGQRKAQRLLKASKPKETFFLIEKQYYQMAIIHYKKNHVDKTFNMFTIYN
jgi:hypothetical protein